MNKTNRCTEFQFYWYYYYTCFRQPFCPSSGVLSRTSALVHFMQLWWPFATSFDDRLLPGAGWNSWWWAERLPETCIVVIPIKLEFSANCWFYSQAICYDAQSYDRKKKSVSHCEQSVVLWGYVTSGSLNTVQHTNCEKYLMADISSWQGYNNWTNGLYGYSWDMMVHTWDTVLAVVKVVDHETGQEHFLDPEVL